MVEERGQSARPDNGLEHPSVRHERSDASFSWVLGLIIAAMCLAALIHYVLLLFFYDYRDYQAAIKRSRYPLAPAPQESLPPEPRLEPLDRLERIEGSNVYARRESKEEVLNSYGPTPEEGFIHVPIDRVMMFLEKNQLPARTEPPAGDRRRENGLVDAGASNSGRMFRGEPLWYEH